MLNSVVIQGRLVSYPELGKTQSDLSLCRFTVAVSRDFVSSDGETRESDFIDVTAWRKTAEFVCKHFVKGQPILIQGSLRTNMYEDKNGNKRKSVDVVAESVYFSGAKPQVKAQIDPQFEPLESVSDSDLPF